MKILFLGDIVGPSGCMVVEKYLKKIHSEKRNIVQMRRMANSGFGQNHNHLY